jgi:hypothetical protein
VTGGSFCIVVEHRVSGKLLVLADTAALAYLAQNTAEFRSRAVSVTQAGAEVGQVGAGRTERSDARRPRAEVIADSTARVASLRPPYFSR